MLKLAPKNQGGTKKWWRKHKIVCSYTERSIWRALSLRINWRDFGQWTQSFLKTWTTILIERESPCLTILKHLNAQYTYKVHRVTRLLESLRLSALNTMSISRMRKMILTQKPKTQILEGGANNNMLHALGQIIIAIRTELILFTKTSRSAPAIKDSEHMGRNQTTF